MMPLKNWVMRNFNELGDHGCFGGERVIFGYAFDLFLMQWLKIYLLMPRGRAWRSWHATDQWWYNKIVDLSLNDSGLPTNISLFPMAQKPNELMVSSWGLAVRASVPNKIPSFKWQRHYHFASAHLFCTMVFAGSSYVYKILSALM
jgi:hypothetical protein